ncbi:MAG: hypothetical protein HY059_09565 [Proteobacteria bacterium]|nr:hypothetical protein [Pseudomonadota bacterium]
MLRHTHRIERPAVDDRGQRFSEHLKFPRREMARATFGTQDFRTFARHHHTQPHERGKYVWHDHNGYRACHHVDTHGKHWWGLYVGAIFFWTVYEADRFWWHESTADRWLYWDDGYWWYDDGGSTYIYEDDAYYRYEQGTNGSVITPAEGGAAADKFFYSDDDSRAVQIVGRERRAFLYDRTQHDEDGADVLIKELGTQVKDVKFSNPEEGEEMQIILTVRRKGQDGKWRDRVLVLDANGERLGRRTGELDEPADVMPASLDSEAETTPHLEPAHRLLDGIDTGSMFR